MQQDGVEHVYQFLFIGNKEEVAYLLVNTSPEAWQLCFPFCSCLWMLPKRDDVLENETSGMNNCYAIINRVWRRAVNT